MNRIDAFTRSAIEAHRWADHDEEWPDDVEWSDELVERVRADCQAFWNMVGSIVLAHGSADDAGHDFALTRNGHGAGFWDGDWQPQPVADRLTAAAKSFGPLELYLGDDGKVYA